MTETENKTIERLPVNLEFAAPADEAAIERTAEALRSRGFDVRIVDGATEAREIVLSLVPEGAEVNQGASVTLQQMGVTEALEQTGRYDALRPRLRSMDRATQRREMRKIGAAPDFFVNSLQAVTQEGQMVVASMGGSQLGPIVSGAGRVILVVGAQKVVPNLATAFRRVEEYAYPLEDARAQETYGFRSAINKLLVLNGDFPGRTTVILVHESVGV